MNGYLFCVIELVEGPVAAITSKDYWEEVGALNDHDATQELLDLLPEGMHELAASQFSAEGYTSDNLTQAMLSHGFTYSNDMASFLQECIGEQHE
jgi:hypothetical protein